MLYTVGKCLLPGLRRSVDMTQQELAESVGLSKQQISDYEKNRRLMSLKNARNISSVLKCHIDDLYEWVPVETRDLPR